MKRLLYSALVVYLIYIVIYALVIPIFSKPINRKAHTANPTYTSSNASIVLLDDGPKAWQARIDAIDAAQESIDITYYSMPGTDSVTEFTGALISAANRGVKVRLLLDGIANSLWLRGDVKTVFHTHPNLEMRFYHPFQFWRPQTWQYRMHDKMLLVDDEAVIYGGRNIADRFYRPQTSPKSSTYDRDVLILDDSAEPSIILEYQAYFDKLWHFPRNELLNKNWYLALKNRDIEKRSERFLHQYEASEAFQQVQPLENWQEEAIPVSRFAFIHNGPSERRRRPYVWHTLTHMIENAQDNVLVFSPYIVPDKWMWQDLDAIDTQANVRFFTNSLVSTNNLGGFSGYLNNRERLLNLDIEMYEYMATHGSLHIKGGIVDDRYSIIGTFNMDSRSAYFNTESVLIIDSPEFAKHMRDSTQKLYLDESLEITEETKNIPEEQTPWYKHLLFFLFRPVASVIESLL